MQGVWAEGIFLDEKKDDLKEDEQRLKSDFDIF